MRGSTVCLFINIKFTHWIVHSIEIAFFSFFKILFSLACFTYTCLFVCFFFFFFFFFFVVVFCVATECGVCSM